MDAADSLKGLTVLGVLPGAVPTDGWSPKMENFPQAVLDVAGAEIGKLDPFWWQSSDLIGSGADASTSWNGGAMTCLFTLSRHVIPDDDRWLKHNAKVAAPEVFVEKPVRLATGGEIGVIVDDLNNISLGNRSVYPLMKLRRTPADRSPNTGIRNGAMVFAEDGGMVGVIVATFGQGEFYSIAPIGDILKWHSLDFITESRREGSSVDLDSEYTDPVERQIRGSTQLVELLEVEG